MRSHLLFLRYEKSLLKNRENRSYSMRDVFFSESFLKRSFEKLDVCDYRRADAYEYRKAITRT